jgi:iron complex outermembrane recepter protein
MACRGRRNALLLSSALAGVLLFAGAGPAAAQSVPVYQFDIPAESLGQALKDFSAASSQQIVFSDEVVGNRKAPALHGSYTRDQALSLLLQGTDLHVEISKSGVLMVRSKNVQAASNEGAASESGSVNSIEEVVVTGTLIKGVTPASPLIVLDRTAIDESGVATLGDLMRTTPESFGGGQNPGVFGTGQAGDAFNYGDISTANLRGLGSDATLTLINGHRLAFNGVQDAVDLSVIPLAAVSRVEIVTDGASALYGSDAIAGVANVILRPDYDGAETTLRWGESSDGGGGQRQVNQIAGYSGDDGGFVADYEHDDQLLLSAGQRSFAYQASPDVTLLPAATRDSGLVSGHWDISPTFSIFTDALYSQHNTANFGTQVTTVGNIHYFDNGDGIQDSLDGGLRAELPFDWTSTLTAGVTRDAEDYNILGTSPLYAGITNFSYTVPSSAADETYFFEGSASGTIPSPFGSPIGVGLVAGYRHESEVDNLGPTNNDRAIKYGAVELNIPIVSPGHGWEGLRRLELSGSVRYEDYSDFGGTTNPKIGLIYSPIDDLALKGTWGTSFHAPSLYQEYASQYTFAEPAADCGDNFPGKVCLVGDGSNPALRPETSVGWTLSQEYTPQWSPGLKATVTEWGIDFKNRIVDPFNSIVGEFDNPVYAPFIVKNPNAAAIATLTSPPYLYTNISGLPVSTSTVYAYYNATYQNAARQNATGFDVTISDAIPVADWSVAPSVNLTHIDLVQYVTPTSPANQLSGTIYNVPSYRARAGIALTQGGLGIATFLNYTSAEIDNTGNYLAGSTVLNDHVSSWTTFDAQIAYDFSALGPLSDFKVTLSVQNLFDTNPPFVSANSDEPPYNGSGYDRSNASPLGRFISLTIGAHI